MDSLTLDEKEKANKRENQDRGRVIRTTNVDFFLNCESMDLKEIEEKNLASPEDEDDPEWGDIDIEELKQEAPGQV